MAEPQIIPATIAPFAQPPLPIPSSGAPLSPLLPAAYRNPGDELDLPEGDIAAFLHQELNVEKLNRIHGWLKIAGRPMAARPLHRQRMMMRDIVLTEQADMHLTWTGDRIYIKPLPRYLLNVEFWQNNLLCSPGCTCGTEQIACRQNKLYGYAIGFLKSYMGLITHESDFGIAQGARLLTSAVTWNDWVAIMEHLLGSGLLVRSNPRYDYGELRLGRLNMIYRFLPNVQGSHIIRGYYYGYNQYGVFFRHNLHWLLTVFAYITIILTAMQVGLGTDWLKAKEWFQKAAVYSTLVSLGIPVIMITFAILLFSILFIDNAIATFLYLRRRAIQMTRRGRNV
ncbi:hypothetical protein DER46DRAFT_702393 [Fusarium sp. MPI-SDFR-AT-0072]|nr:hypothetical protein DER46DRAFT_702393 [Fusarium sp. MPI-SDFR-AT-0072]